MITDPYKHCMTFVYFFLGLLAAIIGALPLGASNIAVMNTTLKQNSKQAMKIIMAAGLAEVLLTFSALHCTTAIQRFIEQNSWLQFTIVVLLLIAGSALVLKNKKEKGTASDRTRMSKYLTGFLLGFLNPPVLAYWILTIGFLNMNNFELGIQSSVSILLLFFLGIYLGKTVTLWAYSMLSNFIKTRSKNIVLLVNQLTGVLLILIGLFQAGRLYFS